MQTGTRVARIAPIERAPGEDGQIERREVRRADDLILGRRPLALLDRRIADDLEREPARIEEIERKRARPGDARDAGNSGDLGLDLIEELLQRFVGRVLRAQRIDEHREHAARRDTRDRTTSTAISVRSSSPAPNSRSTAVATSPMTSSPRSRPPPPTIVRLSDAMTSADEKSVAFQRRHHAEEQPDQQRRRRRRRRRRACRTSA